MLTLATAFLAPLAIVTGPVLAWTMGPPEIIIIVLALILLFGRRLPEVGRSLGKGLVEFKRGIRGVNEEIKEVEASAEDQAKKAIEEDVRKKIDAENKADAAPTSAPASEAATKTCAKCQAKSPTDTKFCASCGAPF